MMPIVFLRGLCLFLPVVLLQPPTGGVPEPATPPAAPLPPAPPAAMPKAAPSDAEKIANARDAVKRAALAVEKLQKRLDDPDGEYKKAETDFETLNSKLKDAHTAAAKLRKDGQAAEAATREADLPALQADWQLAKDRFDIAIRQKRATQEAIAGLKGRITSDQQLLDRLEGNAPPMPAAPATTATGHAEPKSVPGSTAAAAPPPTARPAAPLEPAAGAAGPELPGAGPGMPGIPAAAAAAEAAPGAAPVANVPDENDPVVRLARDRLETRRTEAREAEARERVAEERYRVMERSVRSADKILELERESVAQAEKMAASVSTTLTTRPPADPTEREALAVKLMETEARLADSRGRVQRIVDRLATMNETLAGLKTELDIAARETEAKRQGATAAEAELHDLLSPTAPRNLFRWVIAKGPRILFILAGMLAVHIAVRQFSRHIVRFITRNGQRGSAEDRENRASTLVGVFRYAAGVVVFGGGLVMLMDEVGVPIVPLMGGAAVIGLAVAFGAQNLIRDYFTGFMMLMEDQYSVNDVVRIGAISGQVEQITLRMTVLRDLEGVRHFIPHGTITSVSNLTHGWSRAMLDVTVAYKENVDFVIKTLMQLGRELRSDSALGRHVLEDPEMLGVDSLSDSGVVVRLLLKTRPLQQWPVKREMLRRIKNRFDELGIEIPYPHRTVYHRYPDGMGAESLDMSDGDRAAA